MASNLIKHLSNIPGWRTNRKIIVIESDDWGSIRIPSKEVYDILLKDKHPVDQDNFTQFDSIERNKDLEDLYELLTKFKDQKGNHPVFTSLSIIANPDFEKIKENGFSEYVYEPFTETLKKYPESDKVFELWKQGIDNNIFVPQFHGREHLNVLRWMRGLQNNLPVTRKTFDLKLTGLHNWIAGEDRGDYQAAFDLDNLEDLDFLGNVLTDGITQFKNLLGYTPKYFCPPNGPFNRSLEPILYAQGIRYLNSPKIQKEPVGNGKHKKHFHYLGKKNKSGLMFLTRNAFFEPSYLAPEVALKGIEIAFKWKKPAIISSHRVNFVGRLSGENKDRGLKELDILLKTILKRWPDVEFMTTTQLGDLIASTKK